MAFSRVAVFAVVGLLFFGTLTSLFSKIVYEIKGLGPSGTEQYFRKPWMMTLVMFIGMSFCLPFAYLAEALKQWNRKPIAFHPTTNLYQPLEERNMVKQHALKDILMLSLPTFFDLVATVLMNVGLLSVTASVYQMMRGAEMLFAAMFAVMFLGRRLNKFHYLGILCCIVGVATVGASSILSGEGSAAVKVSQWQMAVGMVLIVLSQLVQAGQVTFEDFFMTDMQIAPMKIVGYEGVFGVLLMLCVMLPIAALLPGVDGAGLHEDSWNTLWIIRHNPKILGVLCFMAINLLMYNISGMNVTGELGAVFRTVLETTRTLFVWLIDLLLHEGLGIANFGESWTQWSALQALGFVILVAGTIIYGQGDDKDQGEAAKEEIEQLLLPSATAPRAPITISRPASSAMSFTHHGSYKSTMNINQFSGSLRSSYPGSSTLHA